MRSSVPYTPVTTYKRGSFESMMSNSKPSYFRYGNVTSAQAVVDWRKKGVVTSVKDQDTCGEMLLGVFSSGGYRRNNTNQEREVNFTVSSSSLWTVISMGKTKDVKGSEGICKKKEATPAATIIGYKDVPPNNEKALLQAVANQPCDTYLDHAVTLVGYGTNSDGTKYWLVKNSWGTGWGENSSMRLERDVAAKEGLCGVAMKASYPIA
ncbi:Senescence-associated protein 12 [Hibiscus syriacus]|uniref:Senescence-associated protein 12 n=1 Tax=Hibiscus syriacus TaxID=106335 RepID=A0A6A2WE95_HIBSY|nr:Senescence-associated protein 12 [Hibiscus syriacus]